MAHEIDRRSASIDGRAVGPSSSRTAAFNVRNPSHPPSTSKPAATHPQARFCTRTTLGEPSLHRTSLGSARACKRSTRSTPLVARVFRPASLKSCTKLSFVCGRSYECGAPPLIARVFRPVSLRKLSLVILDSFVCLRAPCVIDEAQQDEVPRGSSASTRAKQAILGAT